MFWYLITLEYDEGKVTLQVAARSMSGAIREVLNAENCPEHAIRKIVKGRRIRKSE